MFWKYTTKTFEICSHRKWMTPSSMRSRPTRKYAIGGAVVVLVDSGPPTSAPIPQGVSVGGKICRVFFDGAEKARHADLAVGSPLLAVDGERTAADGRPTAIGGQPGASMTNAAALHAACHSSQPGPQPPWSGDRALWGKGVPDVPLELEKRCQAPDRAGLATDSNRMIRSHRNAKKKRIFRWGDPKCTRGSQCTGVFTRVARGP